MNRVIVDNFGPIRHADVEFGDLTILVGAQASGKSLFLELTKLIEDKNPIIKKLKQYGYYLGKNDQKNLLDIYFGEGMSDLWRDNTQVIIDNQGPTTTINMERDADAKMKEDIFYIPAQRILSMAEGRAKFFSDFDSSCPYVLRQFSETIRLFMSNGFGKDNNVVFPIKTRLKTIQKRSFDQSIFHGAEVVMDTASLQRRMKLKIDGIDMPFMAWSAGQKEFMPLLMGFYCLSGPPNKVLKKEEYKYVIIEEPEMGLHPLAIEAILIQVLELMQSGYKVVISTHSSIPLEFAWAFKFLKESKKQKKEAALMQMFTSEDTNVGWLKGIFDKTIKTYYFSRKEGGVNSIDISSLEVDDENIDISEWGGLSSFATVAGHVVSQYFEEEV